MKNIFKVAIVALVGLVSYNANAQFAVKAGINLNNMSYSNNKDNSSYSSNTGFHVGATYEIDLIGNFLSLEPGLFLDTRGAKTSGNVGLSSYESKLNIVGLTIPVLAKGKIGLGDKLALFANVGPYVNIGLSGKQKTEFKALGVSETKDTDVKFGDGLTESKRFNMGLNFGVGAEFFNFILGVGYDLGLTSITNTGKEVIDGETLESELKAVPSAFKVSLGYKF